MKQEDRMTTDPKPRITHAAVYQRLELLEPDEQRNYAVTCRCGFICNWHRSLTGAVRCAGRHDAEAPQLESRP